MLAGGDGGAGIRGGYVQACSVPGGPGGRVDIAAARHFHKKSLGSMAPPPMMPGAPRCPRIPMRAVSALAGGGKARKPHRLAKTGKTRQREREREKSRGQAGTCSVRQSKAELGRDRRRHATDWHGWAAAAESLQGARRGSRGRHHERETHADARSGRRDQRDGGAAEARTHTAVHRRRDVETDRVAEIDRQGEAEENECCLAERLVVRLEASLAG